MNYCKEPRPLFATRKGDGCMKDTDHYMRHPRGHLGDQANAQGTRACAWREEQFGRGQNTALGWSDPTFWQSIRPKVLSGSLPPVAAFRCACFVAKGEAASLLAVKFSSSGEAGFTPLFHCNLTCYFTLDRARHYGNQSDESSRRTKLCAAQTAPEAGTSEPRFARLHAQT